MPADGCRTCTVVQLQSLNFSQFVEGRRWWPLDDFLTTRRATATLTGASQTLAAVERLHIVRVLQAVDWTIEGPRGAAVRLGLHPSTLRSRMRQLGITRPPPRG